MTKYAAHPTLYKGIMMRSRLEARWAAYFDARGWAWTYEPYDLPGYSPDFSVIMDKDHKYLGDTQLVHATVLVEVKPATKVGQLGPPIARIVRVWRGPWMVVGADPDVCVQGIGRHSPKRRMLGQEAPEAWAAACNTTQWKRPEPLAVCARCGLQDHLLHKRMCKAPV